MSTPASRSARAGARSRWRSPSARSIARSPTMTSRRCASGSSRRWASWGVSCVAEPGSTPPASHGRSASHQSFQDGAPRVIVAGATGFAGALAAHLLWRHPRFELVAVTGRSNHGRALQELYPRYRVRLAVEPLVPDALERVDAAIVAYPHAAAAPTVAALHARGARVVDLSADFRLSALSTYEHWYGVHPRPDLLAEAVYGLTELHRERIARASIVAVPGCYPTASV